jgi:hypothetical protein
MEYEQIKEVYRAIERVPIVELKYSIVAVDDRNNPLENETLKEEGEAMIIVNLKRTNRSSQAKAIISHFPKSKEPSWFLIIAN